MTFWTGFWQVVPLALVTSVLAAVVTVVLAERKLRRDYRLEFAAEAVARNLLSHPDWELRSLDAIRQRFGGFDDDELRRILMRAGAVRFRSGTGAEMWGLLERNRGRLGRKSGDAPEDAG